LEELLELFDAHQYKERSEDPEKAQILADFEPN
jgi:hypothetical protein